MPTIAETAQKLADDDLPILFLDTCILLDVIRAPVRKLRGCIQAAVRLTDMQAQAKCRIIASSMIQSEWANNEKTVMDELDRHLASCDRDALAIHESCGLVGIPLSFAKPSYADSGLAERLRELPRKLMAGALHLEQSNETNLRAHIRTLNGIRPARNGRGSQDCTIVEEYLELCRLLQAQGFLEKRIFCSSNTNDYYDETTLNKQLESEFEAVALVFTKALPKAVSDLKKP